MRPSERPDAALVDGTGPHTARPRSCAPATHRSQYRPTPLPGSGYEQPPGFRCPIHGQSDIAHVDRIMPSARQQFDHPRRLILIEQKTSRRLKQWQLALLHRERCESQSLGDVVSLEGQLYRVVRGSELDAMVVCASQLAKAGVIAAIARAAPWGVKW